MGTKEQVLALLEQHRGACLSGAEIAGRLHLSRNAVWKAVNDLRKAGYQIEAATNRGYCLTDANDILSVQGILPLLCENARAFADSVIYEKESRSTNRTAKALALDGAAHGTTVLADSQSSGRGRYSRSFFSPPGGLYLSIILHPERLHFSQITAVTAFAAVAVCEAIEAVTGRAPAIKWVNDLFLGGKKVCGILTEAVTDFESGSHSWVVVGIGINVHAKQADFPPELRETATSLYPDTLPESGIRNRLAAEIINRLAGFDTPPDEKEIFAEYRKRLMMLGKQVTVIRGDETYCAVAEDIDETGRLMLRTPDGQRQILSSGEIRILT